MSGIYDDHGIRFEYPGDWELEVTDDGPRIDGRGAVARRPGLRPGDGGRGPPGPAELADEALAALNEEYPTLDAFPALETIDGHKAVGHDVEFISLDLTNACAIRCFRTPRRTVFVLAQWSDLEGDEAEASLKAVRRSLEETDA